MKILYSSWHEILEKDELKLFSELGYDYLSLGACYNPSDAGSDRLRPGISKEHNLFDQYKGDWKNRDSLTVEQIKDFDVLIFMHEPTSTQPAITKNWKILKDKPIIYRSIGQSIEVTERALSSCKGLHIVRYSPKEKNIPEYAGESAIIRFYKDPEEYKDWNGQVKRVITVGQNFAGRKGAMNYDVFRRATESFERRVFGPHNEGLGIQGGELSYEDLKKELQDNAVFVFTNSQPASYTLGFLEAFMTGIPIVALGKKFMTDYEQDTYEIPDIIEDGVDGFVSDSIPELQHNIKMLLENPRLAEAVSLNAREKAIKLFGKEKIKNEWRIFLESLVKEENV